MGWTAIAWTVNPHGGESKHARALYDSNRKRIVIVGGDRPGIGGGNGDAGNPEVATFVTGNATATVLKDRAGAGLRPAYPDNGTWDYDSRRDRYIAMRSFWFGLNRATAMHPAKPSNEWVHGGLCYNPTTDVWENPLLTPGRYPVTSEPFPAGQFPNHGFGGDGNTNFGVYDPTLDAIIRFFHDGAWGNVLQVIPVADTGVTPPAQTVYSIGGGLPSGSFERNYHREVFATACQHAIDVQGRNIYVVSQSSTSALPAGDTGWGLIKVPLSDPTRPTRIALPSTFIAPTSASTGALDVLLCFDPIRRLLIHPMVRGYGGEVLGTLTYDVDNGDWEHFESTGPPYPHGNCLVFDPSKGVAVLTGGKSIQSSTLRPGEPMPVPTSYFTFAPDASPPPIETTDVDVTAVTVPATFAAGTVGGVYRFTATPTGGSTTTIDSASPSIKTVTFSNIQIGQEVTYTGVRRNQANTANLGSVDTVVTTITGEVEPPPDPDPVDLTPPSVTLTSPLDLATVSGFVDVAFVATDNVAVVKAEVYINDALIQGSRWDSRSVANGSGHKIRVVVYDAHPNSNFDEITVTVDNPVDPPPDPPDPVEDVKAIFLEHFLTPSGSDRAGYVLWVDVPIEFQSFFARPGYESGWPKATDEEKADVEAGRVAEAVGSMTREGTDDEMKARLIVLWEEFEAKVLAFDTWTLTDTFWVGDDTWQKR